MRWDLRSLAEPRDVYNEKISLARHALQEARSFLVVSLGPSNALDEWIVGEASTVFLQPFIVSHHQQTV